MASNNVNTIVAANNQFTTKLFAQLSKPDENVIFSSLSIHTILSLLSQGSNSATEESFKSVLNLLDKTTTAEGYRHFLTEVNKLPDISLEIANKIYVQARYALKAQFKEVAIKQFYADTENIAFEQPNAAHTINKWVESKTNSKIQNLVNNQDLDESTKMVLVNAVYFKGDWREKFDMNKTNDGQFFVAANTPVPCKMMHRSGKYNYKEDSLLDAQIIEIPYKNQQLSMVIALPKAKHQIVGLHKKLATYDLNSLMKNFRNAEVNLSLPTFKMETMTELNEPLKKMGLSVAFTDEAKFTDLLESEEPLKISKVLHKAFVEVNEEGAEAAAASGAIMMLRCMPKPMQKIDFCADHPFVFFIVFKCGNNAINLFSGKVNRFDEVSFGM